MTCPTSLSVIAGRNIWTPGPSFGSVRKAMEVLTKDPGQWNETLEEEFEGVEILW